MVLLYLAFSSPRSDPGEEREPVAVAPLEVGSQPDTGGEAFSRETGSFDDQSTIDTKPGSNPDSGPESASLGKPNDSVTVPLPAEKEGDSGSGAVEKKTLEVPSNLPEISGD